MPLPKAQVKKLMGESWDAAEAAAKIMELCAAVGDGGCSAKVTPERPPVILRCPRFAATPEWGSGFMLPKPDGRRSSRSGFCGGPRCRSTASLRRRALPSSLRVRIRVPADLTLSLSVPVSPTASCIGSSVGLARRWNLILEALIGMVNFLIEDQKNKQSMSYKPPVQDINAPDLYIPLMAFATYIIVAGYALGVLGRFTPEALTIQFTRELLGWFMQVILTKALLYSLGSGESPLLDIVAYAGYGFAGTSLAMLVRIFWSYSYYFVMPWFSICTGVFLVKTMKRVLQAASRTYERHPSRRDILAGTTTFFYSLRLSNPPCFSS